MLHYLKFYQFNSSTHLVVALQSKRDMFRKQETSPAIILTALNSEEGDGLIGEKDIFDLNPGACHYVLSVVFWCGDVNLI